MNKEKLFKPYKDLCAKIANIFLEYAPMYPYPHTLASSVLELAQAQPYFGLHLPSLTNLTKENMLPETASFLEELVFVALNPYRES
jgi:hypothetical protein